MHEETKTTSTGLKVVYGLLFVAVWFGLGKVLNIALTAFREGDWGMWPILATAMVFVLITIDRANMLYRKIKTSRRVFEAHIRKHLMNGDMQGAINYCHQSGEPLGRIVGAGLTQLHRSDEEVQEAVDEAALSELPKIEARTGYLAMMGNVATLLGLLGTIIGLITSFAGVSLENENDPASQARAEKYVHLVTACEGTTGKNLVACIKQNKATILAKGISEATNCTAFGLLVGIVALLAFSVFNGRTQRILDDMNHGVVSIMNFAVNHRKALRMG